MYNKMTVIDIDDTVFNTTVSVFVLRSGVQVKKFSSKDFANYKLKDGEYFDFDESADSELFYKTSTPIDKNVNWIKSIINNIEDKKETNKHLVLFLTARSLPSDHEKVLDKFELHGMNVRNRDVHFAYTGGAYFNKFKNNGVKKSRVINWYLNMNKDISLVRMVDDSLPILHGFKSFMQSYNKNKLEQVKYIALHSMKQGLLERV